ncbi:hypothetical protein [Burkholderia sp. MSMB1078WGS]|uniref:hypothetical protein n=1 Tax=Burkholderia sp. MSMB1078WGS TaxID=1637900 RepID=UPI0027B90CE3|nr:hypothetical protein [Burkholderia sp. MSMB1078WGS]
MIKPQWAYIWEFRFLDENEWKRTPCELTERELEWWLETVFDRIEMAQTRPLERTKVDRNRVPRRDRRIRLKPKMPEFDAPSDAELRALWREYTDLQVRWLILEIVALRKSLDYIQEWFDYVDKNIPDRGQPSGWNGDFQKLRHLLRKERARAGMI